MQWVLYILLCDNSSYYIGISSNLRKRLNYHNKRFNIGTKEYAEVKLVHQERYKTRMDAEKREIQLKKWTRQRRKHWLRVISIYLKNYLNPDLVEVAKGK